MQMKEGAALTINGPVEASLGTEQFFGGVGPSGKPQWTRATVSLPAAVGVPLSKVTFTGSSAGSGNFFLDDITLKVVVPEPTTRVR